MKRGSRYSRSVRSSKRALEFRSVRSVGPRASIIRGLTGGGSGGSHKQSESVVSVTTGAEIVTREMFATGSFKPERLTRSSEEGGEDFLFDDSFGNEYQSNILTDEIEEDFETRKKRLAMIHNFFKLEDEILKLKKKGEKLRQQCANDFEYKARVYSSLVAGAKKTLGKLELDNRNLKLDKSVLDQFIQYLQGPKTRQRFSEKEQVGKKESSKKSKIYGLNLRSPTGSSRSSSSHSSGRSRFTRQDAAGDNSVMNYLLTL